MEARVVNTCSVHKVLNEEEPFFRFDFRGIDSLGVQKFICELIECCKQDCSRNAGRNSAAKSTLPDLIWIQTNQNIHDHCRVLDSGMYMAMPPDGIAEVAGRDGKRCVSRLHQTVGQRPPLFQS